MLDATLASPCSHLCTLKLRMSRELVESIKFLIFQGICHCISHSATHLSIQHTKSRDPTVYTDRRCTVESWLIRLFLLARVSQTFRNHRCIPFVVAHLLPNRQMNRRVSESSDVFSRITAASLSLNVVISLLENMLIDPASEDDASDCSATEKKAGRIFPVQAEPWDQRQASRIEESGHVEAAVRECNLSDQGSSAPAMSVDRGLANIDTAKVETEAPWSERTWGTDPLGLPRHPFVHL